MELEHSFTVPAGVEDAWRTLLDVESIAPCMPGATLESVDGDSFTGKVKVKLGPISITYGGEATFVSKDEASHTAVIEAAGKEARGSGTAKATVTATLTSESADSTRVDVRTDLNITGRPAQFGRGVMNDVGAKLIGQFADCLAGKMAAGATPSPNAAAAASGAASGDGSGGAASGDRSGGAASGDGFGGASGDGSGGAASGDGSSGTTSAPAMSTGSVGAGAGPSGAASTSGAATSQTAGGTVRPSVTAAQTGGDDGGLNLLSVVAGPLLKRAAPVVAALAVGALLFRWLRRR
ncbi:MAG: SRPBCC family protein [Actinomycetales bacterium]